MFCFGTRNSISQFLRLWAPNTLHTLRNVHMESVSLLIIFIRIMHIWSSSHIFSVSYSNCYSILMPSLINKMVLGIICKRKWLIMQCKLWESRIRIYDCLTVRCKMKGYAHDYYLWLGDGRSQGSEKLYEIE